MVESDVKIYISSLSGNKEVEPYKDFHSRFTKNFHTQTKKLLLCDDLQTNNGSNMGNTSHV